MENIINPKIKAFFERENPPTPCLVVDLAEVERLYRDLAGVFPEATCFYAIKANPAREVLDIMVRHKTSFDTASLNEINMCLEAGASPSQILFGNTIKRQTEIAKAYELGVRIYTFDSEAELKKIAESAPGSRVYCRIATDNYGAAWPLSKKFGCSGDKAVTMLATAKEMGLEPYGISFHVGSQQLELVAWDYAIAKAAKVFKETEARGVKLRSLNLGGGFPSRYRDPIPEISEYGKAIRAALAKHFGKNLPEIAIEPGRYIAGDAGVIMSEVILVSSNIPGEARRWVYLDAGKFSGFIEAESIEYRITTEKENEPKGPVVLAGPTCDSIDIIYEEAHYELPLSLTAGDKVYFLSAGAYTTTYSSVAFNGFPPLKDYYIR